MELHAEGQQPDAVRETLQQMEKLLAVKLDSERSAQLVKLKSKYAAR